MDERIQKMAEISACMVKLEEMRGLRPTWDFGTARYNIHRKSKTKNSWLYIFTGTKRDIYTYIAILIALPLITYIGIWLVAKQPVVIPWAYFGSDVLMILIWISEARDIKRHLEEPDDKELEAIVRQKIAELKEIDERLEREKLLKEQEEQEQIESQE